MLPAPGRSLSGGWPSSPTTTAGWPTSRYHLILSSSDRFTLGYHALKAAASFTAFIQISCVMGGLHTRNARCHDCCSFHAQTLGLRKLLGGLLQRL